MPSRRHIGPAFGGLTLAQRVLPTAGAPLTGGAAYDIVRVGHQPRTTLGAHLYTDAFVDHQGHGPSVRP